MEKLEIIMAWKRGDSVRKIARESGLSRNTVAAYVNECRRSEEAIAACDDASERAELQRAMLEKKRRKPQERKPAVFAGDLLRRFEELLLADAERERKLGKNKQALTASNIWRQLLREGFSVGESTVRQRVHRYRKAHPEVFIRQEYGPGETAEFDFHQIKASIGGSVRVYHQATFALPFSDAVFAYVFKDEKRESVMRAIVRFLADFGGVPGEIVFDNLRPVVSRFLGGHGRKYSDEVMSLSAYYGFAIRTCNPRSGNEKGSVENGGKNLRRFALSLNYEFASEEEFLGGFARSVAEFNAGREGAVAEERAAAKPLPARPYEIVEFGCGVANSYSVVSVKGNFYSVDERCAGEAVEWSVVGDAVTLRRGGETVGRHVLSEGHGEYVLDISHYLSTLMRKPGAIARSACLAQAGDEVKAAFEERFRDDPKGFIRYLSGEGGEPSGQPSIDDVSAGQLRGISAMFGQGEGGRKHA